MVMFENGFEEFIVMYLEYYQCNFNNNNVNLYENMLCCMLIF